MLRASTYYDEFALALAKLADENHAAERAVLRRGLGKPLGEALECCQVLPGWLTSGNPAREDACFLVATLFALHPLGWEDRSDEHQATNLGASFRRLQDQTERESIEARFVGLLNCHQDDLATQLRHAVSLVRSAKAPIPIDWARLLRDVENWSHPSRWVQRDWARAFWRAPADEEKDETALTSRLQPETQTSSANESNE